jgi:hypothetical protein
MKNFFTANDKFQLCLRLLAPTLKANQLEFDFPASTVATSEQTSAANNVRPFLAAIRKLLKKACFYFIQ